MAAEASGTGGPSRHRIALCSLLPDTGHLTPLLLMGRALMARGDHVKAFFPDEAQPLATRYGVAMEGLGPVLPGDRGRVIARYAKASQWSREAYWGVWFARRYMIPAKVNGIARLPALLEAVAAFSPRVLLADGHQFEPEYRHLAAVLELPLILHESAGTNFRWQRTPFWFDRRAFGALHARDLLLALEYSVDKRLRPRRLDRRRAMQAAVEHARAGYRSKASPPAVISISTGIAAIELERLSPPVLPVPVVRHFGMLEPLATAPAPIPVLEWLDAGTPRSTLYMASGTMVRMPPSELRRMATAALDRNLRVLLTGPAQHLGRRSRFPRHCLRIEPWVAQSAVLAHPAITAFLTHAGAISIQEALWNGVPVICRPCLWDQHYNTWVAERLGFGVGLPVSGMRRPPIAYALGAIETLRRGALALQQRVRAERGEPEVLALIDQLLTTTAGGLERRVASG